MTNDQMERMIEEHNRQIAEIWALFRESREQFREQAKKTDEQITRVSRQMAETDEQITRVSSQMAETDEQITRVSSQMAETDSDLAETDKKLDKLIDTWARFIEKFLAPGIPRAFRERGIEIIGTAERQKRTIAGKIMEIDIMGVNTSCVVLVEVKTTLRPEHVQAFLERLPRFKAFFPEYKDRVIYGAVAGINVVQAADACAENNGLWVIVQRGDTVAIQNDEKFKPKTW